MSPSVSPTPPQEFDSTAVTTQAMGLLSSGGDPKRAEVLFQRALAINETTHGIGHPLTVASVVDCSKVLQHQKKYEEASVLCRMEMARAEKVLCDNHGNIAPLLAEFAYVTRKCGRHREATELLWRELEIREVVARDTETVRCLIRLCKALRRGREVDKAVAVVRRALKLAGTSLGRSHYETASAQCYLAETLHMVRNTPSDSRKDTGVRPCKEALKLYQEASFVVQQHGPQHPLAEKVSKGLKREMECCRKETTGGNAAVVLDGRRRMADLTSKERGHERPAPWSKAAAAEPQSAPRRMKNDPLPRGWKVDWTSSGRRFFVNRHQRKTTWVDPRSVSSLGDDPSVYLPLGWEKAVDGDGEVYFIDHNTRATQREPPMQRAGADDDTGPGAGAGAGAGDGPGPGADVDAFEGAARQRDARESRGSWGSLSSIFSSVSSLTRSVSSASLSSLSSSITTAKSMFGSRGDLDEAGQLTAHFWSSLGWKKQRGTEGLLPMYVGDEQKIRHSGDQTSGARVVDL